MHRGRSKAVSADSAQGTSPMVHIGYTEEPKSDESGQNQTRQARPRNPMAISILWPCLVWVCLTWQTLNGLESRRRFTPTVGSNLTPSAISKRGFTRYRPIDS